MLVYVPATGNGSLGELYREAKTLADYLGNIDNWKNLAAENPEIKATLKESLCDMLADPHLVVSIEIDEDGKLVAGVEEIKQEIT